MYIKCIKCGVATEVEGVTIEMTHFGCPHCYSLISYEKKPEGKFEKGFNTPTEKPALKIGQKGVLNGVEYTVTAAVVKKVQRFYYWREYILTAKEDEQLYLSETDGHWILLKKIDDAYDVNGYPEEYVYNGTTMKLYDYDDPTTVMAVGFFDYDVTPSHQRMIEYIYPPYIYSVEVTGKDQSVYFGQHISSKEVKKAFNMDYMPYKSGVGIVQPFRVNVTQMIITFCCFAVLILASHLVIYAGRTSETVLSDTITFTEYNGKDFVSKPFTLEGGSAPLTINLSSDVDNSWASVQVALINEKTSDEEYATKDIEYYHGYEGGENWSEGNTNQELQVCGVSAGTYHLVITPQKPIEDITNDTLRVTAEWNRPSSWNMIIPIVIMLVVGVLFYFLGLNFEQRRWADSSYSPYATNE